MRFWRFSILSLATIVPLACSDSKPKMLGSSDVCALIEQIDVDAIDSAEMADNTFDQFALRMQHQNVRPELKQAIDALIGADPEDTYQLYLEAGQAYDEDWTCAPLERLLSIQ